MSSTDWNEWAKIRQVTNWKKWPGMKPGDRHIHEKTIPIPDPNTIRYAKGHYVNRPYFKYASSKWEQYYIDLYEVLFNHLKDKPDVSLLEFGVFTGESIKYFRDFFTHPSTKIVGFDPHPCEFYGHDWWAEVKGIPNHDGAGEKYDGPTHNVHFYNEGTDDPKVLDCCSRYGPFDIIIDDASHYPEWAERYFRLAWPYLKWNGIYLIEDIPEGHIKHLLDEITISKQGKGMFVKLCGGFGPRSGGGEAVSLMLVKTTEGITGLDSQLVEG